MGDERWESCRACGCLCPPCQGLPLAYPCVSCPLGGQASPGDIASLILAFSSSLARRMTWEHRWEPAKQPGCREKALVGNHHHFPPIFPLPSSPRPSPGSHPPLSIGAELSGCCGSLPPCPGPALGVRTSPGSLERLCLLRRRSESCTTCGGEAHPSPRIKITPFFPNRQRVLQCPPAWHSRARPGRPREEGLQKGKQCLVFQAKNSGCSSKIISVQWSPLLPRAAEIPQ